MVASILPRRRNASTVAAILASPEIECLIAEMRAAHVCGRRGYGPRKLVVVYLVKALYVLPTWTSALETIADNPRLSALVDEDVPSDDAVYRFLGRLRDHPEWIEGCIRAVQAALRELRPDYGKEVAADSTDIPAHANGQKYVRKGGPLRERYSDPDASWGHRGSVSTRKGGGFYGYKPHGPVCTKYELPVSWVVRSAKDSEIRQVEAWLDLADDRGFTLGWLVLDSGYDYAPTYESAHRRGIRVICPLNEAGKKRDAHLVPVCRHSGRDYRWVYAGTDMKRGATKWRCPLGKCKPASTWIALDRFHPAVPRETKRSRKLYEHRTAVERFWSRLKEEWGLLDLRVRRLERVAQHVDLTVLAYLLLELAKDRELAQERASP